MCKKRRPYFIVHFISRVSIEYGRMLLSMMMIMCAVHRSQCCMSWCSVYYSWTDRKMITSLRCSFQSHPNARNFYRSNNSSFVHQKGGDMLALKSVASSGFSKKVLFIKIMPLLKKRFKAWHFLLFLLSMCVIIYSL